MALLDNKFKQRVVGALVLIALAIIFLPMLFSRPDENRQVRVDPPAAPSMPVTQPLQVDPVPVPQPQALPNDQTTVNNAAPNTPVPASGPGNSPVAQVTPSAPVTSAPSTPIAPAPPTAMKPAAAPKPVAVNTAKPATPPVAAAPAPTKRIDANGLPESWSVQLASLSTRANADSLQKTLRTQGYNAYVRSADGKNRVYVGPVVQRSEADRLNDTISRQQKLKGMVVRFEPEKG